MKKNRKKIGFDAIIISLLLHIILFGLLIWGSFYSKIDIMGGGEGNGEVIGAVMVDTGLASQEWGRIQQSKKGIESDNQIESPDENKITDDKLEISKDELVLKQKLEQETKIKAEQEAKARAEQEAKARAEQEAKIKAEKEAKAKAEKEAKARAEKEAKARAEKEAQRNALDNFINGGDIGGGSSTSGGNLSKQGSSGSGASLGLGDGGKTGDRYGALIKKEIQRRFLKDPGFINKVCVVEVELLRDGTITNFRRLSGPDDICGAALSAVSRTKRVPSAPNDDIYRKYKRFSLEFKLK